MSLKDKAEKYFENLNSMANRICVDLNETKSSYENLWQKLSYEEQEQILNQTIIKPEISLKYPRITEKAEQKHEFAKKMIVDDHYTYRDEHSGPFSFRTSSQRDLTIFPVKHSPKKKAKGIAPKPKVVASPKIIMPLKQQEQKEIVSETVRDEIVCQEFPDVDTDEADTTSLTHILPKTGLDLLDNW